MQFAHLPYTPLRITSRFGLRNTGIAGASIHHLGIDLGVDKSKPYTSTDGGPVTAVLSATVKESKYSAARGWYILLNHGMIDGKSVQTRYQHLKEKGAETGKKVKSGERIGTMGNTGVTSSLHLHFELIMDNVPVDPEPYLKNIKQLEEIDMTKEEVIKLIQDTVAEVLAGKGTESSSWGREELKSAVDAGITDGTRPGGYCTREQAAIMAYRASEREL